MPPENAPLLNEPVYAPPKPIHVLRNGVNVVARQTLAVTGLGMIALAVPVGIATPFIPIGLPMAILGSSCSGVTPSGAAAGWRASWRAIPASSAWRQTG
ncbi:hypothetical protein [Hyphomonas sp.]|uniref:hypothetical protein n=1 Tax=Hyphomonas sp. TaxID=87 RepID=UPI002619C6BA|nr:hypothetical protein [Hyphomonas sp.]